MERGDENQKKIAKREAHCDFLVFLLHSGRIEELKEALQLLGNKAARLFRSDARLQQTLHVLVLIDGMASVVRWLVNRDCVSLQARDSQGRTALRLVVQRDRLEYAPILLQCGAYDPKDDLHIGPRDKPLLQTAVELNSSDMVAMLMEAGADPYLIHKHLGSALRRAVCGGRLRCVEAILKNRVRPRDSRSEEEYESLLWYSVHKKDQLTFSCLWRYRGKKHSFPSLDLFIYALFPRNRRGDTQDIVSAILAGSSGEDLIAMYELNGVFGMSWSSELTCSPTPVFLNWTKAMELRWADPDRPVMKGAPTGLMAEWLEAGEVQTPEELAALPRTLESTLEQAVLVADRLLPDRPELPWLLANLADTLFQRHADRDAASFLFLAALTSVTCEVTEEDKISTKRLFQRVLCCQERHVACLTRDELLLLLSLAACAVGGRAPHFTRRPPAADMKSRVVSFAEPLIKSLLRQWFLLREPASDEQEKLLELSLTCYFKDRQPLGLFFPLELWDHDTCLSVLDVLLRASSEVRTQGDAPLHLAADSEGNTPLHVLAQSLPADVLPGAVALFLGHEADLGTRNKRGESVADILARRQVPALSPPQPPMSGGPGPVLQPTLLLQEGQGPSS